MAMDTTISISCFLSTFSLLLLSFSFLSTIQGFEPSPAPAPSSYSSLAPTTDHLSPPSPTVLTTSLQPSAAPVPAADAGPAASAMEGSDEIMGPMAPSSQEEGDQQQMVRWCTVRQEEYEDCQLLITSYDQPNTYTWKCIQKETAQECLESIRRGEADLINLEAGLAYTAFINYSMKAIANEVYCDQAKTYQAVAVVNRKACQKRKGMISFKDFQGHRSCHGAYSSAAGWNYPINHIKQSLGNDKIMNDREIATSFFSKICAPSEFEGTGICTGCGNDNGSCPLTTSPYYGDTGAFRCLVEELGDIAFVKADTVMLYSMEGPHNQSWSSKSIRDFMYLCPDGGCREINDYPASCSFGDVPANVIMASNSLPNKKRLFILQTLTNATLMEEALHTGKNGANPLISPSTQEIAVVKNLTRSYLGLSASISQSMQQIYSSNNQSTQNPVSDVASQSSLGGQRSLVITLLSALSMLLFVVTPI